MIKKTVLVTGASGFIGQPLVRALARSGYAVRAATRRPISFPSDVKVVTIPDFAHQIDWKSILSGVDIVVHAADLAHADQSNATHGKFCVICRATQELAWAAARADIERFLYISSVRAQSGPSATKILKEDNEPHPTDQYGQSKLFSESTIRSVGVKFTILRPVVVYGPQPKGNFRSVVRLAASTFPLPFAGLNNRRSFLTIDNLISAILFALKTQATEGETFLVADREPVSIRELFTMLRAADARSPRLFYIPPKLFEIALTLLNRHKLWDRLGGDLIVDTGKLEALGWRPPYETYDGFRAMLSRRPIEDFSHTQATEDAN